MDFLFFNHLKIIINLCAHCFELAASPRSVRTFILFIFELAGLRPFIAGAVATAMAQR